jgi:hypothetical protein
MLCTEQGGWPDGTGDHRIDAVVLPHHQSPGLIDYDHEPEESTPPSKAPTPISALRAAMSTVPSLGVLLGATDLLSRSHPGHGLLRKAAAAHRVEPNAGRLYDRHSIRVVRA